VSPAARGVRGPQRSRPERSERPQRDGEVDSAGATVVPLLEAARRRKDRERRRRRTTGIVMTLAAACLAVVVGLGAPRLISAFDPPKPSLTAMTHVTDYTAVTAEVGITPIEDGSLVTMHCEYRGLGRERWGFRMVVLPRSGGPIDEIAYWTAGARDEFEMKLISRYKPEEISKIEIRSADGRPVLEYTRS
jgi:hypothetical protein